MSKDYLGTYNGSVFYPLNTEDTSDVNIEAIAYALSTNSRFCGHTSKFWSVAQHSITVAKFIRNELADSISDAGLSVDKAELLGLFHDASEAYLSDMCRPIKQHMQEYMKYEQSVQLKILRAFGLVDTDYEKYMEFVKIADDTVLYAEAMVLMNPSEMWLNDYSDGFNKPNREKYQQYIILDNMQLVEAKFLKRCIELCNNLGLQNTPLDKLPECKITGYNPIYCLGQIKLYYKDLGENAEIFDSSTDKKLSITSKELSNILDITEYVNLEKESNYET